MQIINQGRVSFKYRQGEAQPIISETKFSNSVITMVLDCRIKADGKVNKKRATLFEMITYEVNIQNVSSVNIEQLCLKNLLANTLRFITHSVYINGIKKNALTLSRDLN